MTPEPEWLSIKTVSKMKNISERTLRKWCKAERIKAWQVQHKGTWLIDPAELDRLPKMPKVP
ncbi:MAG: helix-turn-helix domain-containing protein [Trueperaceae bacterium]|nr:helix-turn-helix domain-containing protein [Trueperaceae bacterium]